MAPQREWFEKDYYKILGVSETASDKEITRAYRKLAKQYHPDANPGSEDRFKEISAAYVVLLPPGLVTEHVVGGRNLLEAVLRARVGVGVVLLGQLAIGASDLFVRCSL